MESNLNKFEEEDGIDDEVDQQYYQGNDEDPLDKNQVIPQDLQ